MISDRSEFRVHIRRLFVIMIRTSYRWICSHPYLLGIVGVVYLLYRACPLLFSPLLAISPVLVCTFVLLGTILSFGEPNIIPEIETEPEATVLEAALFTAEASRDPSVVERGGESFTVERFVSSEKDGADRLVERDTQVRFEERAFDLDLEKKGDGEEGKLIGNDDGKRVSHGGGSLDDMMEDSKEDQVDVSPVSPWRPMRHEEGDDDSLDSSSDGAESSSPDPSMTDIIPMLDELHPLLHSENPGLGIADLDGSDATSEEPDMSSSDSDEGTESDVNSESHGEEDDNKKEEEEEEKKEDEIKSPIKWTEADQKNVMDLGSLELERNQRLESLIARRRARNNMRMVAERNLIDFDCADVPFNMPPISTARHNPFDLSYDDMGLPPIPGSAPSIMFARRNPFDLPYEPNEEKPDLKGDGFEEEFSSPQPKEPVFRRHESFSVGPSMLGGPRHDRLRPFFVLERLAHERASYYPFERQLSEVSESKLSSVPDTESVCTILEDDEKKVDEDDADRETEIAKTDMASDHDEEKGHSSEDSDGDEQADSKNPHRDVAEIILGSATHHEQSNMMDGETPDNTKQDEEDSSDGDASLSEIEEEIAHISEDEAIGMEDVYHHDEEPAFITALPSREESAIHDLCGLVGDHHETPVYDSTPPSASRFPSFSSVSSDYKADLPGKSGEEVQENTDNEREVCSESIGPGETETSTREVGESSTHVTGETSLLISDHVTTLEESPDVVHDIAESSVNRSVAEGTVQEEEDKEKDEATPKTSNADIPIDSYSTLASGVVEYTETHSFNDEYAPKAEQYPVQSSVSDAKEETHPNQTMDIEVDSANTGAQNVGSEEAIPAESDREPTWSDKSVVEQSSLESGEDQVSHETYLFSITDMLRLQVPARAAHVSVDTAELSCLTSDTSSSPAESPEYETPMVGESSKAEFFQETVNEGLDHVVERSDELTDLHEISQKSQSSPEVFTEEADEIKEIDEGLLSELDTVGDFGVKEVSEPGPSSVGSETATEQTEPLPDVILPRTVQDQLAQENSENSSETKSDLTVVEATSKDDLDTAMNQAVVESMGKQPMSPESDGGFGETKCRVEMEPSGSLVDERSLDETNVTVKNTPEKEEDEETKPKEITTSSDASSKESRSLEEIPKPSEPKVEMSTEVISERVVIPTEGIESRNVTLSDEVATEEAKAETSSNLDGTVQSAESKETPGDSEESISEVKTKEKEKEKEKGKSDSSSSSSSSSSSDSD
ncbi:BnaA10g16890D [Brassica napus]|uniref:BnaA10g16890D protein n=1 Tax=Brassica napus TaxID=3708 RepID=A0A078HM74_BRANA|nr:BnaA10g16890D [Brassica napus]